MRNYTHLSAIEFLKNGTHFIRVFYQDGNCVKESCYDTNTGWYISRYDVVSENTVNGSPIAAISWKEGRESRVYFFNRQNILCERTRSTDETDALGYWQDGSNSPLAEALAGSQIAAARVDTEDATIYICYQAIDRSLRLLKRTSETYTDEVIPVDDVQQGTGISLIVGMSDGREELRLFYQSSTDTVKELFQSEERWEPRNIRRYIVAPAAPLVAVAWNYGDPNNFRIRLYSITTENRLGEMTFHRGWRGNIKPGGGNLINVSAQGQRSGVAVIRSPLSQVLSVFYQPEPNVIGLHEFNPNFNRRLPLGIPFSRGIRVADPINVNLERRLEEEQRKNESLSAELQALTELQRSTAQERDQIYHAVDTFIQKMKVELRKVGTTITDTGSREEQLNGMSQKLQTELGKVTSLTSEKATLTQQFQTIYKDHELLQQGFQELQRQLTSRPPPTSSPNAPVATSNLPANLDGATPLHWAARRGDMTLINQLLNTGAPLEARWPLVDNSTDRSQATPLHWAAIEGQVEAMNALLNGGADINATNTWNRTPLHVAARFGHYQAVKLLVEWGANKEARRDTNETPLHFAVEENRYDVVKYLIDVGADINAWGDRGTPLQFASKLGRSQIGQLLLSRGGR